MFFIFLLPAGSAVGSSVGIVFTREPIFGFFTPQGRHAAPIKVKFGREERTVACELGTRLRFFDAQLKTQADILPITSSSELLPSSSLSRSYRPL